MIPIALHLAMQTSIQYLASNPNHPRGGRQHPVSNPAWNATQKIIQYPVSNI